MILAARSWKVFPDEKGIETMSRARSPRLLFVGKCSPMRRGLRLTEPFCGSFYTCKKLESVPR